MARSVSPDDFGRFSFVLALVGIGLLVSDVGLQVATTRFIAAQQSKAGEYATGSLLIGSGFAVASYLALVAAGVLGLLPNGVVNAVAIFGAVLFVAAGINAYWSFLRGFERQDLVYVTYSLSSAGLLVAVLVAAGLGASVETILALYVGSFLLRLFLAVIAARLGVGRVRWRLDPKILRTILLAAPAVALAYILLGVYSHVDVVLLGFLVPAEDVGSYAAAYRLVDAGTFVTAGALTAATFPVFSRLHGRAPDAVSPLYNRAIRLLAAAVAPAVVIVAGLSGPITRTIYGSELEDADMLLALLAPSMVFIGLNYITAFLALATGKTRAAIVVTGTAAVVNIIANLGAVPFFGVPAAAGATLLAEVVMLIGFHLALRRGGFASKTFSTAIVTMAILVVPLTLATAFGEARAAVTITAACVTALAVWLAGLIGRSDVVVLRRTLNL